jgi:hypothetical protein
LEELSTKVSEYASIEVETLPDLYPTGQLRKITEGFDKDNEGQQTDKRQKVES